MFDILLVLKYLPLVLSAVTTVEATVTAETPGATKKQIILDSLTATVKALNGNVNPVILNGISALIDSTVEVLNIVQVFKHPPAPAKTNA